MHKEVRKYMSSLGKKGGKNLWKDISKEERSKIMSKRRRQGLKSDFKRAKEVDDDQVKFEGYKK